MTNRTRLATIMVSAMLVAGMAFAGGIRVLSGTFTNGTTTLTYTDGNAQIVGAGVKMPHARTNKTCVVTTITGIPHTIYTQTGTVLTYTNSSAFIPVKKGSTITFLGDAGTNVTTYYLYILVP